jgi:hypothetical protein
MLRLIISRGTGTPIVEDAEYPIESAVDRQFVGWRISRANTNFELCSTYGQLLAVPSSISDDDLHEAAAYRSRSRVPICMKRNDARLHIAKQY